METILNNTLRIGNFTSSEIYNLMTYGKDGKSFGKPALSYIEEKNMERKLKRSLNSESSAKPLTWGKLLENRVFDLLGIEYTLTSNVTIQHPTIKSWSGSQDGNKFDEGKTVIDIKCPITLKSFCQLVDKNDINSIRENHKSGEQYYWQLVSNAILTESKYAELVVYVPYLSELDAIRELAANFDGFNQHRYQWIYYAENEELPYLIDGGEYKNLNIIRFEVPEDDKQSLTERVMTAEYLLTKI